MVHDQWRPEQIGRVGKVTEGRMAKVRILDHGYQNNPSLRMILQQLPRYQVVQVTTLLRNGKIGDVDGTAHLLRQFLLEDGRTNRRLKPRATQNGNIDRRLVVMDALVNPARAEKIGIW